MMRFLLLLLAALLLGGAAAPKARDWRTHVVEGPAGWTFGRPGAPLLIEHASFGCPHCRIFSEATGERIGALVRTGRLRLSFRPFLIFPHDRTAIVLARCVAPERRLAFIKALMAAQPDTRRRLAEADADEAIRGELFARELGGPGRHGRLLADVSGMAAVAEAHGLSRSALDRCFADEDQQVWVTTADIAGRVDGITGTPTYRWNGAMLGKGLTPEALLALLPR